MQTNYYNKDLGNNAVCERAEAYQSTANFSSFFSGDLFRFVWVRKRKNSTIKVKKVGYYPLQIRIISADNHSITQNRALCTGAVSLLFLLYLLVSTYCVLYFISSYF